MIVHALDVRRTIYIYQKNSAVQLTSVGLAQARPSEHGYFEYYLNCRKIRKTGYTAQERTGEGSTCGRDSRGKAGKISETEGERQGYC